MTLTPTRIATLNKFILNYYYYYNVDFWHRNQGFHEEQPLAWIGDRQKCLSLYGILNYSESFI